MTVLLIPPLGRAPAKPTRGVARTLGGATMGTSWSVKVVGDIDPVKVGRTIQRELDLVVAQMSPWEPTSRICRFNTAPAQTWVALPPEFITVLDCALAVAEMSGGAFDPTLGALTDLWGFGPEPFQGPPDSADVAARLDQAGWARLHRKGDQLLQPGGLALDFCGVAKGYAVDRVAAALNGEGITAWLVEIGGELRGRGLKGDGTPWWVELEMPEATPANPRTLLGLVEASVATSGSYRRFFDHDSRRFSHTLDPRDGRPVDDQVISVSVMHPDCMWADALATALMVLGPQAAAFAAEHDLCARILTRTADGWRQTLSPAMEAMKA